MCFTRLYNSASKQSKQGELLSCMTLSQAAMLATEELCLGIAYC